MVALSVSTSAKESSVFTRSPTCLFQTTIFPSFIVSLNNGIRITVRSFGIVTCVACAAGLSTGDACIGAGSTTGVVFTSVIVSVFAVGISAEISSPAFPMIAMISFTLAAFPTSTPIYNNVPST